jgi:hypothetical protein
MDTSSATNDRRAVFLISLSLLFEYRFFHAAVGARAHLKIIVPREPSSPPGKSEDWSADRTGKDHEILPTIMTQELPEGYGFPLVLAK